MPGVWRQSYTGAADTCLKRLEFIFRDPPYKSNVNRAAGTGYHAGLATHYMGIMAGQSATREQIYEAAIGAFDEDVAKAEDRFDWTFQPKTYRAEEIIHTRDDSIALITESIDRYFGEGHNWDSFRPDLQVVAVELQFNQDWPGVPGWRRGGTIDLVLYKDPVYILVDHKTAKKKWNKTKGAPTNAQFAWYIKAWAEHAQANPHNIAAIYDVLGFDGSFERRQVFRTGHQIDLTLERSAELALLVDRGGPFPPNPESFLCSKYYCDFWSDCPYGQGLKFNDGEAA